MASAKDFLYKGVAGKASLWQQKADNPQPYKKKPGLKQSNSTDPCEASSCEGGSTSGPKLVWDGTCYRQQLAHGEDYGRPEEGTKTAVRGNKAGKLITSEVIAVCANIMRIGYPYPDGTYISNFGTLFEMYTTISNKLVGMLLRARRQGLVQFDGEMLFQGRDDHVVIRLIKVPKNMEASYIERNGSIPEHMKSEH